jgi:hypothetical protein
MEFLNPTALFGLLALPLLLIPYLIRRKPRRMVFSSLLLFLEGGAQATRPLGRIHLPPLFFLQLLLLALLILALSEPVFSVRPTNVALVLDNSASMQALEEGKSRFDLAKETLGAIVGELGPSPSIDLYLTTPRLAKINRDGWNAVQALDGARKLDAYDLGDAPIDYDQALNQLAREQKYQRVYLFTDHPATEQTAIIRVVSIGRPQANLAVTSFDVHRGSLVSARMEANAVVRNFSGREEKIQVALKSGGTTLASREISIAADKTAAVNFDGFAERPYYEIELGARDALALDNRRFAVAPRSRSLRILAVTPRPQAAASLKTIQGVSVDTVSPGEYGNAARSGHDLEIFHYASPARLPESPALFILPPDNSSLVDLGPPMSNTSISGWREPHPLTRYVNFSLLRPIYARPLRPQTAGQVIIDGPGGALAFAVEQRGIRYLTLGFDPLPYLGRDNLPMSIFTLNFLDWFFESGGARGQATGEPIPLSSVEPGESLTTPAGESVKLQRGGYFQATFQQGVYRRSRGGASELFVRNLDDIGESDLRKPTPIALRGQGAADTGSPSVLFSFWPYLLLATLLLFMLEWFVFPRSAPTLFGSFGRWRRLATRR